MDPSSYNDQRRLQNAALPREKLVSRLQSSFEQARRAFSTVEDVEAPGPYGPTHTKGQWLRRIVDHAAEHRQELEELLVG
jgi:hypothetical protein